MIHKTIKEIYKDLAHDLYDESGINLSYTQIHYIIRDYFKSVHYFLSKGKGRNDDKPIENVSLYGLGLFKFNRSKVRGVNLKRVGKKISDEDSKEDYKYISSYGWQYLTWIKDRGFLFINGIDRDSYALNEEDITTHKQAIRRFREIVETNTDIKWNHNPEIKEVYLILGEVYKYGTTGMYMRSYDSIVEAANNEYIDVVDLIDAVKFNDMSSFHNMDKTGRYGRYRYVKGATWLRADGFKGERAVGTQEAEDYIYSALDTETGKTAYRDIGNGTETAWFLKKLLRLKKPIPTNALFKAKKSGDVAYGFRWQARRSTKADRIKSKGYRIKV